MKPDKEREGRERMRSEMKGNIGERKLCTLCRGWNRRQNHTVGFIGVSVCGSRGQVKDHGFSVQRCSVTGVTPYALSP